MSNSSPIHIAILHQSTSLGVEETAAAVARAGMIPQLVSDTTTPLHVLQGFILLDAHMDLFAARLAPELRVGKPMLGMANGAIGLLESGWVPGLEDNKVGMGLVLQSDLPGVTQSAIRLAKEYQRNAFTRHLSSKQVIALAAAPFTTRFELSPMLWAEIVMQGLDVFHFCDVATGQSADARETLAAVSNKAGNLLAMAPLISDVADAASLFDSMRDYIIEGRFEPVTPLTYYPRR